MRTAQTAAFTSPRRGQLQTCVWFFWQGHFSNEADFRCCFHQCRATGFCLIRLHAQHVPANATPASGTAFGAAGLEIEQSLFRVVQPHHMTASSSKDPPNPRFCSCVCNCWQIARHAGRTYALAQDGGETLIFAISPLLSALTDCDIVRRAAHAGVSDT